MSNREELGMTCENLRSYLRTSHSLGDFLKKMAKYAEDNNEEDLKETFNLLSEDTIFINIPGNSPTNRIIQRLCRNK